MPQLARPIFGKYIPLIKENDRLLEVNGRSREDKHNCTALGEPPYIYSVNFNRTFDFISPPSILLRVERSKSVATSSCNSEEIDKISCFGSFSCIFEVSNFA